MLNKILSQLQDPNGSSSEEEDGEEEDVDVALKKEVAQLKASKVKQERRFQALDSGANNVVFIKTHNLGNLLNKERRADECFNSLNLSVFMVPHICALPRT